MKRQRGMNSTDTFLVNREGKEGLKRNLSRLYRFNFRAENNQLLIYSGLGRVKMVSWDCIVGIFVYFFVGVASGSTDHYTINRVSRIYFIPENFFIFLVILSTRSLFGYCLVWEISFICSSVLQEE